MSNINKQLSQINEKHQREVFRDFLALSMASFCKDEDGYMSIMNSYRNDQGHGKRPADFFAKALSAFLILMSEDSKTDHLGHAYEDAELTNDRNGQFFTPDSICQLSAQITVGEADATKPLSIGDPACGSGRMLIATMPHVHADSFFYGIDVDHLCVDMTALNLLVRNANAIVVHGNCLSLEAWGGYKLSRTWQGGAVRRLTNDEALEAVSAGLTLNEQASEQKEHNEHGQLQLFEEAPHG